MTISDETLMAYADGELDAAERAAVETAMRDNSDIEARIARHRALAKRIRIASTPELSAAVPERLLATVMAAPRRNPDNRRPESNVIDLQEARRQTARESSATPNKPRWRPLLSMAASVLVGIGVGYFLWQKTQTPLLQLADRGFVARGQLADALTNQLAADQTSHSRVSIGLSFVAKSGEYCRTFALAGAAAPSGLACRHQAEWEIQALDQNPAAVQGLAGYRTASSPMPASILKTVEERIAGEPLDSGSEKAAVSRGWARGSR